MSSLNIDDLFRVSNEKELKELQRFDQILKSIHKRIINHSKDQLTYCVFPVPYFILGVPTYDLINY